VDDNTGKTYPVKIHISAYDRSGLVRDVAALVADERVNMRNIEAVTGKRTISPSSPPPWRSKMWRNSPAS
jgi:glycine cleavage system regulatory protein